MKAAVAAGRGVEVREVPPPVPGPGQVLAVPLATGICGSDLHLVDAYDERGPGVPPIVMGHEFCAEVIEGGPGAERIRPGTRVVSVPYARGPQVPELLGLSPVLPGGFGERMVLDEELLLGVPDHLPDEVAALTEPLAVGVHAVAVGRVRRGDVALVVGCGPIGLCVIGALKAEGHGPVVACDVSPGRRAVAEELGADVVVDPGRFSPYGHWRELGFEEAAPSPLLDEAAPRGGRVVAFECVGVPGVLQQVIDGVPRHSRLVVVGACTRPDTLVPVSAVVKELTLSFVFAYRRSEFARALELLADGRVLGAPLVTGHVDLDGVPAAFDELRRANRQVKVVVRPG